MTESCMNADIVRLERLAEQLIKDARTVHLLNPSAMISIADIIRRAIGAPISWPTRYDGARYADDYYRGNNDLRMAFNHGVKWAVEHYHPAEIEEATE
jgi:hypothetical protein